MRVLELYSGIGGMHYALQESGVEGCVVTAIDINTTANDVYKCNFPSVLLMNRCIEFLTVEKIRSLNIDTIFMSPPCQPFTRVGQQKDMQDARSTSLLHVLSLIPEIETLKYILLENVVGFETSEMRKRVIECLIRSGFRYKELILSPCQFGIPNTRHRYYLLAKKECLKFCFNEPTLEPELRAEFLELLPRSKHYALASKNGLIHPKTGRRCYKLKEILEKCDYSSLLLPKKVLEKQGWILDIRVADSNGSCCFTKAYSHYHEGTGSVYCPFTKELIIETYDKCKDHVKSSEEQGEILSDLQLRYFSPKEVSRLMCFPEVFKFPENITNKQRYRLLGNSINVHVVSRLIFLLHTEKFVN